MAKDPIKKAENGTYYFRANLGYHPVTGKQIQKYRSGFSTKKEARAEYSKLILASTEELADKKEDITFKKFIEEIYLPWYKTQVKESTYKNRYSTIQKHFAYFYKKKVSEIEAINVQTWQLKLAKQFSPNYVRIVQGMLCLAFDRAIILGLAKKNPARMIGNIKSKKVKIDFWTLEEFQKVISLLYKGDYYEHYLFISFWLLFMTGMRIGEAAALQWDDIDFENQVLYVRRSMYYDKDLKTWELKVPKNGKPRAIDFGDSLAHILLIAKHEQQRNKKIYGDLYQNQFYHTTEIRGKSHCQIYTDYNESYIKNSTRFCHGIHVDDIDSNVSLSPLTFVCTKPDGELLTTQTLKWCNKVVQKNLPEISHFHFHCLRHTYASTLVLNGANIKDVQSLLGHSDIKITLNTYSHVTEKSRKKAVNIFENAISDKIG